MQRSELTHAESGTKCTGNHIVLFSRCSLSPYISLFCSFSCGFIIIESMQRIRSWSALWSSVESRQEGLVTILGAGITSHAEKLLCASQYRQTQQYLGNRLYQNCRHCLRRYLMLPFIYYTWESTQHLATVLMQNHHSK